MQNQGNIALISEMLETSRVIRDFDFSRTRGIADEIVDAGRVFIAGEGSSRIFPGKNFITEGHRLGLDISMGIDGSYQACEYDLSKSVVLVASNSGQTKETLALVRKLRSEGHDRLFGVTATPGSLLDSEVSQSIVLTCGPEKAVAATKSVVEQALVYQSILGNIANCSFDADKIKAAVLAETVMSAEYDADLIDRLAKARAIFFAGRNNGVAEELALKTTEITHKPCMYLEGTLAFHGVEEIMREDDVVIFLDPYESEFDKTHEIFEKNVGAKVLALSANPTPFSTIRTPQLCGFSNYLSLMAGWNLLVQTGLRLGVNLDKPNRARKIGNAI